MISRVCLLILDFGADEVVDVVRDGVGFGVGLGSTVVVVVEVETKTAGSGVGVTEIGGMGSSVGAVDCSDCGGVKVGATGVTGGSTGVGGTTGGVWLGKF